jgi:SsrA-binding protein
MVKEVGKKLIAQNKKARHDFSIEDVYECGIVLTGTEVKSLRAGRASLIDGFAMIENGELWLHGVHIPEYTEGTSQGAPKILELPWFRCSSISTMAKQKLR